MADIEFRISGGPFAAKYEINLGDITANDVGDLLAQGGPDLDKVLTGSGTFGTRAISGLVWIVKRRGSKGLAYRAVADHISMAVFEPVDEEGGASVGEPAAVPDPSSSGDA